MAAKRVQMHPGFMKEGDWLVGPMGSRILIKKVELYPQHNFALVGTEFGDAIMLEINQAYEVELG